ncbi:MAG TPA: hypothetical protein VNA14_02745 [Mycobacteriales bacterium]|nr:hypothetical protein [Mycobacteriales bacterium]
MDDVIRLSRAGRRARLAATAAVLAGLAYGTIWGTDDHFPFGPLTQYAFAADPNGTVADLYLEADTTAGTRVRVLLMHSGVGVGRAEIEGQLDTIRRDPSWLQGIADAQARLHPDEPRYTHVYVRIRHVQLRRGVAVGERMENVADWRVR